MCLSLCRRLFKRHCSVLDKILLDNKLCISICCLLQQQQQQQQSQPSQQSQFSQLTKPIASVNQPSLILHKHQALRLQNIPQQQQHPPVFHPGSIAQQPAPTKLVQSLDPTPVLPPAVATTSNSTEHVSPEGYKYHYNSITSEKASGKSRTSF
ncbi:hypothetical protein SELMODRAFT_429431 [Selaginella moellendorffii]|uniref:Uncharacterized protein n=1 Tax=Selaginella moellendorffii TaxID=88036 RepID=D8T653_SELML|nr:hypothetical protein SELMODRAFT_429431 [Selaginella moellendorffii]